MGICPEKQTEEEEEKKRKKEKNGKMKSSTKYPAAQEHTKSVIGIPASIKARVTPLIAESTN